MSARVTARMPVVGCPKIVNYTDADWARIEEAVKNLPEHSPLLKLLNDYLNLRDKAKVCEQIKRNGLSSR